MRWTLSSSTWDTRQSWDKVPNLWDFKAHHFLHPHDSYWLWWVGWCLIQLSWVHWKLIWVPESGLTGGWRVVPSLSCLRSSGMGGGWSPGWLIGLGLRGIQGGWLEQNRSRDCREPISHHFTFHSILVSEGEAFQSWPKVEGPHKFSLVACYFCFAALRWTFCSLCSSGFHLQLTHASRNGCSFQK